MSSIYSGDITKKNFINFVWPSIAMMLVIALKYNIDSILVANMLGEVQLAAVGIAYPVQGLMWGVSVMLASGSSALVAIKMGEGDTPGANRGFSTVCLLSILIGFIFLFVTMIFMDHIVSFLGAEGELAYHVKEFLRIFAWGFPAAFIGLIFEYFIRVDGRPAYTLVLYFSGAVAHVIVAVVCMGKFDMGMAGDAWGNVVGLYVTMIVGGAYFIFAKTRLKLCKFRTNWRFIGHCFVNGSSEMVSESAAGICMFFFNLIVIKLAGATGVAAVNVVLNIHYFVISIYLGYIMGIAPLISYFYGAKEYKKVDRIIGYSKVFIVVASILSAIAFLVFAGIIVQLFERPGSELYELSVQGVKCLAPAVLIGGINVFASGFFTAYGNGMISAVISASRALIMVIVGMYLLSWLWGMDGIWHTLTFAEAMTLGLTFTMFGKYKSRYKYNFGIGRL
ncbi:MAG: MATE family efflux transporter [Bacillota bacterium]|nr:MATE family efflux transporter [Bacillota bacterium]